MSPRCWRLISTAWLLLTGTQDIRSVGDMARFGATLFQLLAPLQMALVLFFSALLAAERRGSGKGSPDTRPAADDPPFRPGIGAGADCFPACCRYSCCWPPPGRCFCWPDCSAAFPAAKSCRVFAVTLAAALAAGSIGSTLALWREKTFQTLALAFLTLMFWLALAEILVAAGNWGFRWQGVSTATWGAGISPWRAVLAAARPLVAQAAIAAAGSVRRCIYFWRLPGESRSGQCCGDRLDSGLESVARIATLARGE